MLRINTFILFNGQWFLMINLSIAFRASVLAQLQLHQWLNQWCMALTDKRSLSNDDDFYPLIRSEMIVIKLDVSKFLLYS